MKRIIATIAAIGLAVSTAFAAVPLTVKTDKESLQRYGRSVGCKNLEVVERTGLSPNGVFMVLEVDSKTVPFIRLIKTPSMSDQHKLAVFYHELGHCMQFEAGDAQTHPAIELDADRRGAGFACREGMDGPRMTAELMDWFHDTVGYDGDEGHGTLEQRKAAARSAPECQSYR